MSRTLILALKVISLHSAYKQPISYYGLHDLVLQEHNLGIPVTQSWFSGNTFFDLQEHNLGSPLNNKGLEVPTETP